MKLIKRYNEKILEEKLYDLDYNKLESLAQFGIFLCMLMRLELKRINNNKKNKIKISIFDCLSTQEYMDKYLEYAKKDKSIVRISKILNVELNDKDIIFDLEENSSILESFGVLDMEIEELKNFEKLILNVFASYLIPMHSKNIVGMIISIFFFLIFFVVIANMALK